MALGRAGRELNIWPLAFVVVVPALDTSIPFVLLTGTCCGKGMSDGEDNMMDDEDYEFDYEDSDQDQDDGQVDMENEYYTAKG